MNKIHAITCNHFYAIGPFSKTVTERLIRFNQRFYSQMSLWIWGFKNLKDLFLHGCEGFAKKPIKLFHRDRIYFVKHMAWSQIFNLAVYDKFFRFRLITSVTIFTVQWTCIALGLDNYCYSNQWNIMFQHIFYHYADD